MSKLPHVSLFLIFSAMFLPNITRFGLQLGNSYHKSNKGELFIATQCNSGQQRCKATDRQARHFDLADKCRNTGDKDAPLELFRR